MEIADDQAKASAMQRAEVSEAKGKSAGRVSIDLGEENEDRKVANSDEKGKRRLQPDTMQK